MSEFRPMLLPLRLAASLVLIFALGAAIGVAASPADPLKKTAAKVEAPAAYVWSATRIGSGLRLRGTVPSEEVRRTLLGMVKAQLPDLAVVDRLKISAAGAPPQEQWLGAVSFGLKQLSRLQRGSVRLLNIELKLDGEARSAADYAELRNALAGPLPTGLTITADTVRPPTADPFVFVADLGKNTLSLSGSVPNETARKQLRDLSRRLFERPGLDDRLEFASGAPKDWNEAVTAALRALSRLDSGKIAMSGLAVTIEGVAPDKGTAVAVSYQLRRDLPEIFSTSEKLSWKEAATPRAIAAKGAPSAK